MGFPLPVGEHRGGRHQQHRPLQFLLGLEVLQEGQQLNRLAQAHVVGQAGPLVKAIQEGQPAQAPLLVGPQLAAEARRGRQRIRCLLLVVLLQHRLQPRGRHKAMHRQAMEGIAVAAGEPQGIVEAELGIGGAEALGIFEIAGAQLNPDALVLHQRAALGRQPLQVPQGERHPADHELPTPVEALPQGEPPRALRQLRLYLQSQPAGQAAGEAGGQHHPHPHIPQPRGGRAHQHEGLRRGELQLLRRGRIQPTLDRFEQGEGPPQALQQQFARQGHSDLAQLQLAIATGPHRGRRHLEAGVGFRLQRQAQLPELLPLLGSGQFQAGAGWRHLARHRLAPVVGGHLQPLGLLLVELELPLPGPQGPLPGAQQRVELLAGLDRETLAQLAIEQGFQEAGHPQPTTTRPPAAEGGFGFAAIADGTGGHLGQADGQGLQPMAIVLAVEQRQPVGPPLLHQGQPAPPGDQAEAPALQVGPPAQVIGQVGMVAGEGQAAQPLAGGGGLQCQALHLPGPPLHLLGYGLARQQRQASPGGSTGLAAPLGHQGPAGQGEAGAGRAQVFRPQVALVQPGGQIVDVQREGMLGRLAAGGDRLSHAPGIRPEQQATARTFGGKQPGGVQQAHQGRSTGS